MKKILIVFLLAGCAGSTWRAPEDFVYTPIKTNNYEIATWQKINNPKNNSIHIYIEGDGNSFDAYGRPTSDPTPYGTFVRDLATHDTFDNVVYMARPCQFIKDDNCKGTDWTTGRFSQKIVESQSQAIKQIANNKNVILIGYSGGAMLSGLVIRQNPKLKVDRWITIAGVLDHKKWTQYFDDMPLNDSLNLEQLPKVKQIHFVGEKDEIVPYELAKTWANEKDIKVVPNATHNNFGNLNLFE